MSAKVSLKEFVVDIPKDWKPVAEYLMAHAIETGPDEAEVEAPASLEEGVKRLMASEELLELAAFNAASVRYRRRGMLIALVMTHDQFELEVTGVDPGHIPVRIPAAVGREAADAILGGGYRQHQPEDRDPRTLYYYKPIQ